MRIQSLAIIIIILLTQPVLADDFVKKFDIPGGLTLCYDSVYLNLTAKQLDFNGDGIQEIVLRDENYSNFSALNIENGYSEIWSYFGDPASICPECINVLFRFNGVHSIDSYMSHVVIGYEAYIDYETPSILGLLIVRLDNNTVEWQLDDYSLIHTIERQQGVMAGLDDLILNNRNTGLKEVWGWGTPISGTIDGSTPSALHLNQNYPNPFNPTTNINFELTAPGKTTLIIYNINGHKIWKRDLGQLMSGMHHVAWDGRDRSDRPVASGTYLYELRSGTWTSQGKMMLIK